MFSASADIRNVFYAFEVPAELSKMFSLPFISNKHFSFSEVGGEGLSSHDMLIPFLKVLPKGWNWSLHWCQSFVSNTVSSAVGSDRLVLGRERGQVVSENGPVAGAAYVDN